MKTKLSVVIPCLNEFKTIPMAVELAKRAARKNFPNSWEVIVADNGSNSKTVNLLRSISDIRILDVPIRGYGAALHWGITHAKGDYVFFADADLSYDFRELRRFVKYVHEGYDLILGSRIKGKIHRGAMPFLNRYLGTPVLSFLIRLLYGLDVSDCNSGMRVIKTRFYGDLHMRNSGMEWASELLLKTALNKGKYKEVKISYFKDKRGGVSTHLVPWRDGWRHLKAILLLKPESLLVPALIVLLVSIATYTTNIMLSVLTLLVFISLILSLVAAWLINCSLKIAKQGWIFRSFLSLPIVEVAIIVSIAAFFVVLFPFFSQKITFLIIICIVIYDMWVFLIETIKTHLVNSLK